MVRQVTAAPVGCHKINGGAGFWADGKAGNVRRRLDVL